MVRAAFSCGRDRPAVNDQAAVFVYLFALVPRRLGLEIEAECRGQHGGGKILGLFTTRLCGHAVSVQLRYISIHIRVCRSGQTETGVDMTPEFIGLRSGQYAESDVPGLERLDPYFAGNNLAARRESGRYINQVLLLDIRVAQREFERGEGMAMDTYPLL